MKTVKVRFENCMYCEIDIAPLAPYYLVQKSVKPKGDYKRWQYIGAACETCVECNGRTTMIEDVK